MKQKIKGRFKHDIQREDNGDKYKKIIVIFTVVLMSVLIISSIYIQVKISAKSQDTGTYDQVDEGKDNEEGQIKKEEEKKAYIEVKEMQNQINEILDDDKKYYGIYYYDLNTGVQFSVNGDDEFHAASTIKVPIAMMVADKLNNNEISEKTLIEYTSSDDADGAGILQGEISEGDRKCVSDLMRYMIKDSDNIATSMLKKEIGSVSDYIADVTSIDARNSDNFITPKQSFLLLKKLYDECEENVYYGKVIQLMKQTSTHDRIDKYIPDNLTAHKIGDYQEYVNDIGIIYTKKPYILAVYTKDVMEEGRENIAKVSKAIYDIKNDN